MKLVETTIINGLVVGVKILSLLGINKLLAIFVGPSGYALIGQLQSFIQALTQISSGGFLNGIVRYTAEYDDNESELFEFWKTAISITLIVSLSISISIYFYAGYLSKTLFHDDSYRLVLQVFSVSLLFFPLNSILLSILNGKREIYAYAQIVIFGSVSSLIVVSVLVYKFDLFGALLGLVTYQVSTFFVLCYRCKRYSWFSIYNFIGNPDKEKLRKLASYSIMALVSALIVPFSHLLIRDRLILNFGKDFAGNWEAVWRLSGSYLMFVTGVLSFYFLPKISALNDCSKIRVELLKGYKILIPFMLVTSLTIYFLKEPIFLILFSEHFDSALSLIPYQLIGDFFRASGFLLGYVMIAKGLTRLYVVSEVIFSSSFYILTICLCNYFGEEGVAFAYTTNLIFYNIFLYLFVWIGYLGKRDET